MNKGWHHTEKAKQKIREGHMGKYVTEETRQKIREIRTGTHLTEETKQKIREATIGKKNHFYGKHHTEETKKRIGYHHTDEQKKRQSEAMMGNTSALGCHRTEEYKKKKREAMMGNTNGLGYRSEEFRKKMQGKNNPNYIHGKSNEPYPLAWTDLLKESIRYRDNYTCQLCGVPERECLRKLDIHHIDYDKKNLNLKNLITLCNRCNGKVNSNREYWTKYFQRVIALKERR